MFYCASTELLNTKKAPTPLFQAHCSLLPASRPNPETDVALYCSLSGLFLESNEFLFLIKKKKKSNSLPICNHHRKAADRLFASVLNKIRKISNLKESNLQGKEVST